MLIFQMIGAIFLIVGVIFSILGVVGILRLPDTYTRLHASGKTSTLGILFICVGTAFIIPMSIPKLLALAIFIIFSGPVGSHAIAAAVHRGTAIHNRDARSTDEIEISGVHRQEEIDAIMAEVQGQD